MTWDSGGVAEPPTEWDEFRRDVFGDPYMVWHDGADYAALMQRWRDDPDEVLGMLGRGLREGDDLPASTVIHLHRSGADVGILLADLVAAAERATGVTEARIALALFELTGDQRWSAVVLRVLATDRSQFTRLDAADMAGQLPVTDEVVLALALAVRDSEYLVRYHAVSALSGFAGSNLEPGGLSVDLVDAISKGSARTLRIISIELAEACGAGTPVLQRLRKR